MLRRFMYVLVVALVARSALSAGILKAASEPRGAVILVDEKPVARAPCSVRIPAGFYTVSAKAKGYETEFQAVEVLEGKTVGLEFRLRRTPVKITVKCNVKKAFVCIDGIFVGMAEEEIDVSPGTHVLAVVAKGYRDSISKVNISKRGKTVNVKLSPGFSFRSGILDLNGDQWVSRPEDGWRSTGGSVVFLSGDFAALEYKTSRKRSNVFALSVRFRCKNVKYFRVDGPGFFGSDLAQDHSDGRWHTVLFEAVGRSVRSVVDGGRECKHGGAINRLVTVCLSARAPDNNDAYYVEIGSVILREFDSAQQMAAVLGRSVIK